MRRRDFVQLSLGTLAASTLPRCSSAAEIPKLREIARSKGLLFGSAVSDSQLKRPDFTPLLLDQCSILVAENQMKWRATHPEQDRFDFTQADFFMDFAELPSHPRPRPQSLLARAQSRHGSTPPSPRKTPSPSSPRTSKPSPAATKAASIPGTSSTKPSIPRTKILKVCAIPSGCKISAKTTSISPFAPPPKPIPPPFSPTTTTTSKPTPPPNKPNAKPSSPCCSV